MSEHPHFEALTPAPIRASGCRRINLDMRARLDQADRFTGLPRGTAKPFTFLFAFQGAEPYLNLPPHTFKLVSWLVGLTKPQDWEEGSRPIASPSAQRQAEFLGGLSAQRVKMINRALCEAGIFVMRDHPQGRRFCRRDKNDRIIEAYGFDLSLLALRYDEFVKIAADAKIERERMRKLRRQATLARRAIMQAAEELGVQGHDSDQLRRLMQETAELVKAARACDRSDELGLAVKALERRKEEAEQMLRQLLKPVETDAQGQQNLPHSTSTTLTPNDNNHTVIASEGSSRIATQPVPDDPCPSKPSRLFPEALHLTPVQLVELAPRLAPYMPARFNDMSWPAVIEAALWLSGEMKINSTLWARACQVMGREYAAVALAIVSTRPAQHFTSGPGGYFAGMLRKFEENPANLCLARTIWKLKDQAWGNDKRRRERRL
jgi:replication initiation protein RepC